MTQTFTYPEVTTIDIFYTNDEGFLVTPETLEYGTGYSLVEVQAPYGYVINTEPVFFDVTQDNSDEENGVLIVEVTKSNMPQKQASVMAVITASVLTLTIIPICSG